MSLLDEPADIHAEIGTKTWARGLARAIRCNAEKLDSDVQHIQDFICIAAEHDAWKVLGYVSLDAFLISEANFTEAIIEAIRSAKSGTVADAIEEAKANKDKQQGKRNDLTSDKLAEVDRSGTSNGNVLRRLARDQPELLDKIESGELTVNQAAIQAGIRKKPSHNDTALKAFRRSQDRVGLLRDILSAFITEGGQQALYEVQAIIKACAAET
jgi:hypothetical protein